MSEFALGVRGIPVSFAEAPTVEISAVKAVETPLAADIAPSVITPNQLVGVGDYALKALDNNRAVYAPAISLEQRVMTPDYVAFTEQYVPKHAKSTEYTPRHARTRNSLASSAMARFQIFSAHSEARHSDR